MTAKKERQEELLLIKQKWQELNEERERIVQIRQSIHQRRHDLEIRENRMVELEPLIPSVKQLQNIGISFELILPYMESLNEKAVAENIDLRTAAYNLTQDLRDYRQLGSLRKCVEQVHQQMQQAKQQLGVLYTFTAEKEPAVISLINLENAGVKESEVIDLINIARFSKQYDSGIGQGNGCHNNNTGFVKGNGSKADKGFKLDDKLNL